MTRPKVFLRLILLALLHPGLGVAAQEWTPTCRADCGFKRVKAFSLGDDGWGIVGPEARVARLGPFYYVADQDTYSSIQVFHRDKGFAGSIGRNGAGPGEFANITDLAVGPSGNLWVLDSGHRRISIFRANGAEGTFLESFPIPFSWPNRFGLLVLPDNRFLLNATIATQDRIGMWTHLHDKEKGVVWSIEDDPTVQRSVEPEWRSYAENGDGAVWVAWRHGEYRLELRRLSDGGLIDVIEPRRSWFEENLEERPLTPREDTHSGAWIQAATILDIYLKGKQLWVLGEYGTSKGTHQVIEVLDIEAKELLFSKTFPPSIGRYFVQFDDDGLVVEFEMTNTGTRLHFWSMALEDHWGHRVTSKEEETVRWQDSSPFWRVWGCCSCHSEIRPPHKLSPNAAVHAMLIATVARVRITEAISMNTHKSCFTLV